MVNGYAPRGVAAVVATLIVVDPDVVTEVGSNVAVVPDGRPVTLKLTVPVKPSAGMTVTVYVVLSPGATVRNAGERQSMKSGPPILTNRASDGTPALFSTKSM
jgi:hypothetical protein